MYVKIVQSLLKKHKLSTELFVLIAHQEYYLKQGQLAINQLKQDDKIHYNFKRIKTIFKIIL